MAIHLEPYDPDWARLYELIAADIRDALGTTARSIDHVGSTAIPNIRAKPVIDVLVLVTAYDPSPSTRVRSRRPATDSVIATRTTSSSRDLRTGCPSMYMWWRRARRNREG